MKKIISILLALLTALSLAGCSSKSADTGDITTLRFSDAISYDAIRELDGRKVSIIGYMATLSPISGKYMYLMNMPYQACPFCVPNTAELSNTMAVYAPEGKTFEFTDQAIMVTGTIEVGENTDEYGYSYNYRIVDAGYVEVDLSTVSDEYALWHTIAADSIVADINSMFDYLHFICQWTEYQGGYTDEAGNEVIYYLYPGDALNYLADEGIYGFASYQAAEYFPGLISRIRSISADHLEDLVAIVSDAQALEQTAAAELSDGNYSYDEAADKYTLNNSEQLYDQWYAIYLRFSAWLAQWEL